MRAFYSKKKLRLGKNSGGVSVSLNLNRPTVLNFKEKHLNLVFGFRFNAYFGVPDMCADMVSSQ